jgi:asparagine synthetase B (glutamine-hydrolysing)/ADP-heptose:LPS heptosyltransferase
VLAAAEQPLRPDGSSFVDSSHEQLRTALADTVRHHLVADVPVGVFLSSGLDSTTLAALASEQHDVLRTVTLGFEEFKGTPQDETGLAEKVAAHYCAEHRTIWVTRADFLEQRERLFAGMDQPSTDGVNTFFVSLATNRVGLKVALSGVGGDEMFGGYPSFMEIPRAVRALPSAPSLRALGKAFRVISHSALKRFTSPKYAGLFEYGGTYAGAYLLRRGMFMPWELPEVLDANLVREGWEELQPLVHLEATIADVRNPRLRVSLLESSWYMRNQLLRDSDWAGMAHSLEIRTPLVDVKLLADLAPLLASDKPPTKRDVALTPARRLPEEILSRRKTGFSVPVREWLMEQNPTSRERGLRGWAHHVYDRFPGTSLVRPKNIRANRFARRTVSASASRNGSGNDTPRRILVFRIGQLGDTIVALPAMHAVKRNFPEAHLALLCDHHPGRRYVLASDLLRGAGIFDEFLSYPVSEATDFLRPGRMASLLATIRRKQFDTLVYLAPTSRKREQILRDYRFFSLAGIKNFIGMEGFHPLPLKRLGLPLDAVPHESELLLARLATSGLHIDGASGPNMDLGLGPVEEEQVAQWQRTLPSDGARAWLAVAPGSKMPAKRWPVDRFEAVVRELIGEFDIWPVVFGGAEDRQIGNELLRAWGRGYNAAGALSLRPAIAAIRHCQLFLGNDTGTMHMAAAVGVPCVVTFSSRDRPGLWYPHGEGHHVFRSEIECEGCGLVECVVRQNECLRRIENVEVHNACRSALRAEALKHDCPALAV